MGQRHGHSIKLSELGYLRPGYQIRAAVKHDPKGANPILQMGSVRAGLVDLQDLVRMNLEKADREDCVEPGDILIRSRGTTYGAAIVPIECPPHTVAAAPLYILRVSRQQHFPMFERDALPEYIVWYLNRETVQNELTTYASGSTILTVSLQTFANLEVIVPPMEEQRRIIETDRLLQQERALTLRLLDRREEMVQSVLEQILKKYQ